MQLLEQCALGEHQNATFALCATRTARKARTGDDELELEAELIRAGLTALVAHQAAPLAGVLHSHVLERQLELVVVLGELLVAVLPLHARIGVAHGAAAEHRILALLHHHFRVARLGLLPAQRQTCARVSGGA